MTQTRTYGEAVKDTSTALGRAVQQNELAFADRLSLAQAIVEAEGITLEEAFARLWAQ